MGKLFNIVLDRLHGCRALLIVAELLGGVASASLLALGLRVLGHKVNIAVTGGLLFILSGRDLD